MGKWDKMGELGFDALEKNAYERYAMSLPWQEHEQGRVPKPKQHMLLEHSYLGNPRNGTAKKSERVVEVGYV